MINFTLYTFTYKVEPKTSIISQWDTKKSALEKKHIKVI